MRKFKITVNGKDYEVGVEEIRGESRPVTVAAPAPQPVKSEPVKVQAARVEPPKAGASSKPISKDGLVTAPMPGTVSDILVKVGDKVSKGQVLVMLEAMKMQNEIMAGYEAVVEAVHTSKGASVDTGDPLVALRH